MTKVLIYELKDNGTVIARYYDHVTHLTSMAHPRGTATTSAQFAIEATSANSVPAVSVWTESREWFEKCLTEEEQ